MHIRTATLRFALLAAGMVAAPVGARADVLRIGLAEDPNLLDPAQSGTLGERFVFAGGCAGRNRGSAHAAICQVNVCFHGRIAAAVKDLSCNDFCDFHRNLPA